MVNCARQHDCVRWCHHLCQAPRFFLVSCGSDGNLSYTSVSRAQISSEVRHYCVSDGTHCSADVCCAKSLFPPFKSNTKFFSQVLHGSTSTSSQVGTGTCGYDTSRQFEERERYNSDKCCAGDTVLVDLNYLPELPSRSVDGVATVCFFSVLGPRSEHTSGVPVN